MINIILASLLAIAAVNLNVRSHDNSDLKNEFQKNVDSEKVVLLKEQDDSTTDFNIDNMDTYMIEQLKKAYMNIHPNLFNKEGLIKKDPTLIEQIVIEEFYEEVALINKIYNT